MYAVKHRSLPASDMLYSTLSLNCTMEITDIYTHAFIVRTTEGKRQKG